MSNVVWYDDWPQPDTDWVAVIRSMAGKAVKWEASNQAQPPEFDWWATELLSGERIFVTPDNPWDSTSPKLYIDNLTRVKRGKNKRKYAARFEFCGYRRRILIGAVLSRAALLKAADGFMIEVMERTNG